MRLSGPGNGTGLQPLIVVEFGNRLAFRVLQVAELLLQISGWDLRGGVKVKVQVVIGSLPYFFFEACPTAPTNQRGD